MRARLRAQCDIMRFRHRARGCESSPTEAPRKAAGAIRFWHWPLHATLKGKSVGYPAERGVVPAASAHSFSTDDMIRARWAQRF